jgi:glycosyltransferase involved in cell wall biosynthesis
MSTKPNGWDLEATASLTDPPFVSVVVPTWNRAGLLADCLKTLRAQDYPLDRFEIIVVDDGSTDATPEVVRRFQDGHPPEVRDIHQEHKGVNAARNQGIAIARGDPICFVEDDTLMPPGWLRALVEGALRHPEAGVVGGPIRLRFEGTPPRFCGREPLVGEGELELGANEQRVPWINGGNLAAWCWVFHAAGYFDEQLPQGGEETEWLHRVKAAGYPVWYIPSAWLWHRRTAEGLTLSRLLRRYFIGGTHYAVAARRMEEPFSLGGTLRSLVLSLLHFGRRRCTYGLLKAVWLIGFLAGRIRREEPEKSGGSRRCRFIGWR